MPGRPNTDGACSAELSGSQTRVASYLFTVFLLYSSTVRSVAKRRFRRCGWRSLASSPTTLLHIASTVGAYCLLFIAPEGDTSREHNWN